MSKLIQAVNAMIANANQIKPVLRGASNGEYFFMYGGKHKWSISKNSKGEFFLTYYAGTQSLADLAALREEEWIDFNEMVVYNSRDLGTREAIDSFRDLYSLVQERLFGVDAVLDDIIGDDPF